MFGRITNLIYKELLQIGRDRMLILMLIAAPVLQLVFLGWSTGKGTSNLMLAVLDMDHSAKSRALTAALDNTKELLLRYNASNMAELNRILDAGDADIGVIIPPNFAGDMAAANQTPQIQIIGAATNYIASSSGLAAAEQAISGYLSRQQSQQTQLPVDLRTDIRFNPTLNTRYYSLPAMVGMIVFELSLLMASLGLTREREIGTLEQLIIMPFQRIEIIIGKAIPPLLITLADFPLMLLVVVQVFGTPMQGSLALLMALTALFMMAEIGWGLLISTIARTQQQAVLFVFVQAITDLTFSGFLVPVENMPGLINALSNLVPLRHYLVIIRGIMLKGATLPVLWPEALALALLALAIGTVAVLNLGRRLD